MVHLVEFGEFVELVIGNGTSRPSEKYLWYIKILR